MRIHASLASALILASASMACASNVTDPGGRFTAVVPDGWTQVPNIQPPGALMMRKNGADGSASVCSVAIVNSPATTSKTQKEIDDELSKGLTSNTVKASYELLGFKDVNVEKQSTRDGSGHVVFQNVLTLTIPVTGGSGLQLKVFEEMHALPGQIHDLGCMTAPANYDTEEPEFKVIGLGYRPQGALVAWNATPSVTLFANASYHGSSAPVSTDTPDVSRLGWIGQTGSVGIADTASWQVCEGANYTGRCMVLNASLPGRMNQTFHVGSLQRMKAQPGGASSRSAAGQGAKAASSVLVTP
jgi:hypothetical protein